eukprot:MONOS_6530.1-p1 / transcript=MONOS_6530.1 / gene=MONOS_6530 / organism=Monocercomonoides_exilis_PA203 / gene_product=importin beta subunit / transcript_product=importin beta subunit / location=Mono_scaffold00207:19077-22734(+) / protein_length=989 / sequence_SO=supercontig / SO=protein_coding / is_pseudo=false
MLQNSKKDSPSSTPSQSLLRERAALARVDKLADEIVTEAEEIEEEAADQTGFVASIAKKADQLLDRFPAVGNAVNAIRGLQKRNKIILASVIGAGTSLISAIFTYLIVGLALMELDRLEKENFCLYILNLATEMANESNDLSLRQLAGLILKNCLVSENPIQQQKKIVRWAMAAKDCRDQIKQMAVVTLQSPYKEAGLSAGQVVAGIGKIELPLGQWPDLISGLLLFARNERPLLKEVTLRCLGIICQDVPNKQCLAAYSDSILQAVVEGMDAKNPPDVILSATNALHNSLEAAKNNFKSENERNYIMQMVLRTMKSDAILIKLKAYECLLKIGYLYYPLMLAYMQEIYIITNEDLHSPNENVQLQALEFWTTISDVEIELDEEGRYPLQTYDPYQEGDLKYPDEKNPVTPSLNILTTVSQQLTQTLIQKLASKQETYDSSTWNPIIASANLLKQMAKVVKNQLAAQVMPFVKENLTHATWQLRDAAIQVFGCILEGPDQKEMEALVSKSLMTLLKIMETDPQRIVRGTTSWVIQVICSAHYPAVKSCLQSVMTSLYNALDPSVDPYVSKNACTAISNICLHAARQRNHATNILTPYFSVLFDRLLDTVMRCDPSIESTYHLRTNSLGALGHLVSNCAEGLQSTLVEKLKELIDRLKKQPPPPTDNDGMEEYYIIQGNYLTLIGGLVARIGVRVSSFADHILGFIYPLMAVKTADVEQDVLLCFENIAMAMGPLFLRHFPVIKQYLIEELQVEDQPLVTNGALGLLSDIARGVESSFTPYLQDFVPGLIHLIQSNKMSKQCHAVAFTTLGDIVLATGEGYLPYLPQTMGVFVQAMNAKIEDGGNLDVIEYVVSLRTSLLVALCCVIQGLRTHNKAMEMIQYKDYISNYIVMTIENALDPATVAPTQTGFGMPEKPKSFSISDLDLTSSEVNALIDLIGDLIHALGQHVATNVSHQTIRAFIDACTKSKTSSLSKKGQRANHLLKNLKK